MLAALSQSVTRALNIAHLQHLQLQIMEIDINCSFVVKAILAANTCVVEQQSDAVVLYGGVGGAIIVYKVPYVK